MFAVQWQVSTRRLTASPCGFQVALSRPTQVQVQQNPSPPTWDRCGKTKHPCRDHKTLNSHSAHVYCPVTVPFGFSTSRLNMRLSSCSDHTVNTSHPPTGHPTAIWRKGTFPARVIKKSSNNSALSRASSFACGFPLRRPTHAHGGGCMTSHTPPSRGGAGLLSVLKRPRASRTQPH